MTVKQISVFVENKSGNLADVTALLGENGIDISALSLADTTDFGIARMIVSDPDKAVKILKGQGMAVKCTDVTALAVDDVPGGLSEALKLLKQEKIEIEYMYAFVGKSNKGAMVVMRVSDPQRAQELFGEEHTPDISEIYRV